MTLRDELLLALANADVQRWTEQDLEEYRHMAEMAFGPQTDAVLKLLQERKLV